MKTPRKGSGLFLFLILSNLGITTATPASEDGDPFFEPFPQNQTWKLISGETVKLPLHFADSRTVMLTGFGSRSPIEDVVGWAGLYPVLKSSDKALINLLFIDHLETSIGPYREAMIAIPVTTARKPWYLPNAMQNFLSFLTVYI